MKYYYAEMDIKSINDTIHWRNTFLVSISSCICLHYRLVKSRLQIKWWIFFSAEVGTCVLMICVLACKNMLDFWSMLTMGNLLQYFAYIWFVKHLFKHRWTWTTRFDHFAKQYNSSKLNSHNHDYVHEILLFHPHNIKLCMI